MGDALGWNGIVLLAAAMIVTSLWILHRQMLSEGNDVLLSTGLTLLAAAACSMHWLARPHVFSLVLVAFWAGQLRAFEQGRLSGPQLFLRLVPLAMLWVNLHAGFLTGLILIGIYCIGAGTGLLARDGGQRATAWSQTRLLALLGVSCFLASLLNPNGWKLYAYLADFLQHTKLVGFVNEFRSPDFHTGSTHGFVLLLGVLAITLIGTRARLNPTEILLIGWAGCFALRWVRNVPIFAIVVTPILARQLSDWLRQAPDSRWLRYRRISRDFAEMNRIADGRWLVAGVLIVFVLVGAKPRIVGGEPMIDTDLLTNRFPVAAVRFLRQHPQTISGEVLNDYGWGGYLILVMPEHKVFVDGRNDFYGPDLMQDFSCLSKVCPDWESILRQYGVGWTILPRAHPLNELLALRTDWRLAYGDDVTAIYVRKPE